MNNIGEQKPLSIGRVVSTKMDKTIGVLIERRIKHPLYGKYITKTSKLLVHDENNEAKLGDLVTITNSKPISKRKSWKIVKIIEQAQ